MKGRRITIWHRIYWSWISYAIDVFKNYIEYIVCRDKKERVYRYIKRWDGNPISYSYLAKLSRIDEWEVQYLCMELENEELIDSNENLVWIKR